MKKLLLFLALLPVLAHARYEDLYGDNPSTMSETSFLWYLMIGLAVWCWLVSDRPWRVKGVPVFLALTMTIAGVGWGMDGVGLIMIAIIPVGLLLIVAHSFFPRKD